MTLINHPATQPIRSLRYFVLLLQEVQQEPVPDSYWQHLEFNLERCEDYLPLKQDTLPDRAYPFLEQANTVSPDGCPPTLPLKQDTLPDLLSPTNYKRNPEEMMMFTFIPLLIDGGTYSQA